MFKFKLLALTVIASLVFPLPAAAEPWHNPSDDVGPGAFYASIGEPTEFDSTSSLQAFRDRGPGKSPETKHCFEVSTSGICNLDNPNIQLLDSTLIAPYCLKQDQENCLESLRIFKEGAEPREAEYLRSIAGPEVKANKSRNLSAGGTMSLFEVTNHLDSSKIDKFAVKLGIVVNYDKSKKKFYVMGFNASVIPYVEQKGDSFFTKKLQKYRAPNGTEYEGFPDLSRNCYFEEDGLCGAKIDFQDDVRVGISFRVSKSVDGWFSGRIKSPEITVKEFSSTANLISVDASPIDVPRLGALVAKGQADEEVLSWLRKGGRVTSELFKYGGGIGTRADFEPSFGYVSAFKKQVKDTAAGVSSSWNFLNLTTGEYCASRVKGLVGFVATNATAFQGTPPKYSSGFLNYKVSGLHFLPDGKEIFRGTYDLLMRSDYARCLYGFDKAPLSATVTVLNEKGSKTTATTVVSEKNGWLKMAAYGFTFSKKTIKVRITKKKK